MKIRLYITLTSLISLSIGSGYFVVKDELQSSRIRNFVTMMYSKLPESPMQKNKEHISDSVTIESSSSTTTVVEINDGSQKNSQKQTPTIYVPVPPTYVEYKYEPTQLPDYSESEEYKKWKEEFDKEYQEAKENIEDTKKEMEQRQEQWCKDYPDSMFCN